MSAKFTKNSNTIQNLITNLMDSNPLLQPIVDLIVKQGGRALLVGGAVRDYFLHQDVKDIDIEVHGCTLLDLQKILQQFGPVSFVGKAFGVFRLHGVDIDWSLPRLDQPGRKPVVTLDPYLSVEQAFRRRDLTMNAMGIDLHTGELIDPFNGLHDMEQKILRTPDEHFFIEDPLRFYRVMQFIARFNMQPDQILNRICSTMDISTVSVERIEQEFQKMLLRSARPSRGLRWLKDIGRVQEILPALADTIGVLQDPKWHPEGDVFEHTMQTVDAAAGLKTDDLFRSLRIIYAALCHDLGKVTTTEILDDKIMSHGHAQESARIARRMLRRCTRNNDLIDAVCVLVNYHMQPIQMIEGDAKLAAYKRLAKKLAPYATIAMLAELVIADRRGRNQHGHEPLTIDVPEVDQFLARAQQARVVDQVELPLLHGKDLLDLVPPGPQLGILLKRAYELQLEEEITDKEELKRRVLENQ